MSNDRQLMIVSNQVRCRKCADEPFSAHRHDFVSCRCGAVDGGHDYLRRTYAEPDGDIERSIELPAAAVDAAIRAVEWARATGRNDRGTAYAVLRALRDAGVAMTYAPQA